MAGLTIANHTVPIFLIDMTSHAIVTTSHYDYTVTGITESQNN